MEFIIIETNEVKEITMMDRRTGTETTQDIMGNYDALKINADSDYVLTQEDYEWWTNVSSDFEKVDLLIDSLLEDGVESDLIYDAIAEGADYDLEDQPKIIIRALNELR